MKLEITLRTRLVVLVVAAVIPLLGLSVIKAWLSADAAITRAGNNLKFAATLVAANQARVADSARQVLLSVAHVPGLLEGRVTDCPAYFSALNQQLPAYVNLGLIGLDGHFFCHGADNAAMPFVGDRDYFQATLARRDFVVGNYTVGRVTGKPLITFTMPVKSRAGDMTAVAFAGLDLDELSRSVADAPLPAGGRLVITDRLGTVLAANPEGSAVIGQRLTSPLLQEALKTMRTGAGEAPDREGRQRLYAFAPSGPSADAPFFIAVSADRDWVVSPVRKQLGLELMVLALVAFLGGWIAWMMGGRAILDPTHQILQAIEQVEKRRLDVHIAAGATGTSGEFSKIAAGFNRMTDSLQAHRAALEAELERSRAVQENLQDAQRLGRIGYWQFNPDTQRIWCSDEAYELLGLDPALFDGSYPALLQVIHPADRAPFEALRKAADEAGTPLATEFRVVTPAGELRWIHLVGRMHGQSGSAQPLRRSGVIQDITPRKQAELDVARVTEMLNRAGAIARVGGWELVFDTMTPYWSDEIYRIHELAPGTPVSLDEAIGFYAPEARPVIRAAVEAALRDATPWDLELPLITAKGRRIRVRTEGRALLENGKVVRLAGALSDITKQHESHEHLRLLETCISRLNDIVLITEAEALDEPGPRIVFVNDAFERRTGYSRQEVLGQSPRLLQGPQTDRAELDRISRALKKWQPVRAELINYTKTGEAFWIELDIVPVADSTGWYTHWVAVERDISQRKLAEQALRDSEHRYAALFNSAPVPMWVFDDVSKQFLTVNNAAVQSYGYSAEEFMAMTLFDIRHEVDQARLREHFASDLSLRPASWRHRRKDASMFPVNVVSQPIQYAGRAARFVVALDISAQVKAEHEVQEYLFTLQRAADAAQAITWHQTLEGTVQEVAEQARGVIGAHHAAVWFIVGSDWTQAVSARSLSDKYAGYSARPGLVSGTGIEALVCGSNRTLRMTQAQLEANARGRQAQDADGSPALRGWLAVPLTGRNGKNIGLLQLSDKYEGDFTQQDEYVAVELAQLASAAIENAQLLAEVNQLNTSLEKKVTERTLALARQEALFRALAEQAPQVVWTADPQGAVRYFNRAWFELVGGSLENWEGTQWFSVVHPEDLPEVRANWQRAVASRSQYSGVRRLLAQDGSCHTMAYRASPVLDERNEIAFWVGIDADITEIKAIEAALRLSNQELEAFSYSVSHDLRSPLNTIDGFSRLLAKQLTGQASDKVQHYLARIQAGVAQMGQLIEDLLALAQVSRMQLQTESVDLSALARRSLEAWRERQPERSVTVHIDRGLQAQGDGRLLRMVMENLLGNAWKFTSRQADAVISVGQTPDAAGLPVFFVRDNGAGFDMAYADKLFNPFQRLHAASEFPGTGVGLATVSRIISRHGGRIWAQSVPEQGATFFFTLPTAPRLAGSPLSVI